MSRYQYQPIVDEAREIRLLSLLPSSYNSSSLTGESGMHVLIDHVYLEKKSIPDFEALSYVWGTQENPSTIYVGKNKEHTLEVTRNLAVALKHLQHETQTRILWIDAICIDQENLQERSQQVIRMGDIFRLAPRMTAWLGPGDEKSHMAIELLIHVSSMVNVDWSHISMTPSEDAKNAGEEAWADCNTLTRYSRTEWDAIISLLGRSWFGRLWIRQEIWLSQERANVVCGKDTIPWVDFRTSMFCLCEKSNNCADEQEVKWAKVRDRAFEICRFDEFYNWMDLLERVRAAECVDPKDKVYGMLSLIPERASLGIRPDYSKGKSEVYKDLVLRYIDQTSDLGLLKCCHLDPDDRDDDLPSWVPNLERKNIAKTLREFEASGHSASRVINQPTDERILRVTGICVGTVEHVHDTSNFNSSHSDTIEIIRKLAPFDLSGPYVGGGHRFNAFSRAITAATDNFELHTPPNPRNQGPEAAQNTLRKFLDTSEPIPAIIDGLVPGEIMYLDYICQSLRIYRFITTLEGYLGIGSPAIQVGDRVCVLLGLDNLMLLRPHPSQENRYEVVGEANMYGLMHCEGLLGSVPEPYEAAYTTDPSDGNLWLGFLDRETEEWQADDPRLGPLPNGWTVMEDEKSQYRNLYLNEETGEKTWRDPRMAVEELTKRGVELEEFYLV